MNESGKYYVKIIIYIQIMPTVFPICSAYLIFVILGAALIRGWHSFQNSRFYISSCRLFYGFDRFLGLISLDKGLFGGYWGVARKN